MTDIIDDVTNVGIGATEIPETIIPDEAEQIAACAEEEAHSVVVPQRQRAFAAAQLATASALLEDYTPESEQLSLRLATSCIRLAMQSLAKGRR